jgi:hypothetical protein
MPALSNPRWEKFAQALFEGLSQQNEAWRAYSASGYTQREASARADSSRLLRKAPEIIERVRELQQGAAAKTVESVETIVAELRDVAAEAKADRAHTARTGAIGLKARILGLDIARVEQGRPGEFNLANAQSPNDFAQAYLASTCDLAHDSISEDQIGREPETKPAALIGTVDAFGGRWSVENERIALSSQIVKPAKESLS